MQNKTDNQSSITQYGIETQDVLLPYKKIMNQRVLRPLYTITFWSQN